MMLLWGVLILAGFMIYSAGEGRGFKRGFELGERCGRIFARLKNPVKKARGE